MTLRVSTDKHTRAATHGGIVAARGFTLVELVVILLIISVLAVAVMPRLTDTGAFEARGFHDELIAAVRYAQKVAVATGCTVRVQLSGDAYALVFAGDCSGAVEHPATRDPFTGSAPPGVPIAGNTFSFDSRGAVAGGTDQTIVVGGGGDARTFTVVAGTGYLVRQS